MHINYFVSHNFTTQPHRLGPVAMAATVILFCITSAAPAEAAYTVLDLYTISEKPFASYLLYAQSGEAAAGKQLISGSGVYLPSGAFVDLTPTNLAGFNSTAVNATNGVQQVGRGTATQGAANGHALLWNGTANSAVDLHPTFFAPTADSAAYGTNGAPQVGSGGNYLAPHALVWNGNAESAIDMHPAGFASSVAKGTDGIHQVGSGRPESAPAHALMWSGTADSVIDLSPTQFGFFSDAFAEGVAGNQQVGYYQLSFQGVSRRAVLWTGSAESAVNLNPTNLGPFASSQARATNGRQQVGYASPGSTPTGPQAMIWTGTAESGVSLQALLPSEFIYSDAYSIDNAGNVFGVAVDSSGATHAIEWQAIPEPSLPTAMILITMTLLRRRLRTAGCEIPSPRVGGQPEASRMPARCLLGVGRPMGIRTP